MATAKAEVDRIFAEAEAALKNPAARDYKVREAIQRRVRAALQEDAEDRISRPREPVTEEVEALAITSALEKLKNGRRSGAGDATGDPAGAAEAGQRTA
jgi:hypothetical protein